MKRYLKIGLLLFCIVFINIQLVIAKNVEINIYSFNDFHGALRQRQDAPGIGILAGAIKDLTAKGSNNILVAAGDLFGTTVDAKDMQGMSTVLAFNELGVDCIVLGNHEFDYERKFLNRQKRAAEFPFLAANIKTTDGSQPFKAYKIIEKDGVKIAFIGMITKETVLTVSKNNLQGLELVDPRDILPQYIDKVRAQGADIVILLSHIGSKQDSTGTISDEVTTVLKEIGGLDGVISGHTHKAVNGKYQDITVVQANCYGQLLAHIKINYSQEQKTITSISSKLLNVSEQRSFIPDTNMSVLIQPYIQAADERYKSVIAFNEQELLNNRFKDSQLANCFTDLMRSVASAEIALLNAGAVRKDYQEAGEFTLRHLIEIFPFDNSLVVAQVRGADILAALNYGIENARYGTLRFSGLQVTFDPTLPSGQQITKVTLSDGSVLDADKLYKLATVDFLVDGGDGFAMLTKAKNKEVVGQLVDVLTAQLEKIGKISYQKDNRLMRVAK